MSEIICENVTYDYSFFHDNNETKIRALKGIDLQIKNGEFVTILGTNGSGKSTLAKHFNGLFIPSDGVVYVNNLITSDVENLFDIRSYCGMVFQNPDNQIVGTIVEDDVAFGVENLGVPQNEIIERVNQALEDVGMIKHKETPPNFLSGGQKQRVTIAGILAMKPRCIVLDEPTAMLDPIGRKNLMAIIKKMNKEERITIVLITHFMEEAVESDRIIVMNNGIIEIQGTPREIFKEVDKIKNLGLDVPQVTEIAYKLSNNGLKIREDILTIEEMVEELCQYKLKV